MSTPGVGRGFFFGGVVASLLATAFVQCVGDDPSATTSTTPDASSNDGTAASDGAQDSGSGDTGGDAGPPVPEGNPVWSMIVDPTDDSESFVASDAAGYIYLAVGFTDPNTAFADKTLSATGAKDIAVVKLTPDGKQAVWAAKIGGTLNEEPHSISVDATGVYVSGMFFSATVDVAGVSMSRGTSTRPQGFVAKLNPTTGAGEWASSFKIDGVETLDFTRCRSVRATASGIGFSCDMRGAVTYPGGTSSLTDRTGAIVGKLDPTTGNVTTKQLVHSNTAGTLGENVLVESVDFDANGNLYFVGTTKATKLVVGGVDVDQSGLKGATSGFVMKLKPDLGSPPLWFRIFGSTNIANSSSIARSLRVDAARSALYVAGSFTYGTNLGFADVFATADGGVGKDDVYVVKLDLLGTPQWQKPFGAESNDVIGEVDVDPWGRPVVAASMAAVTSASIDGKALPSGNLLVAVKLDPQDGKALSVTARKASSVCYAYGLASSPANGHTVITGHFVGTLEFEKVLTAPSDETIYLVDLTP